MVRRTLGALFLTTVILSGCADDATRPDPTVEARQGESLVRMRAQAPSPVDNVHTHFLELSDRIPGFAGIYFDGEQSLVVRLKGTGGVSLAREVVADIAARGLALGVTPEVPVRTVPAEYSYTELAEWYLRVLGMFDELAAVYTTIDVRTNRIAIGIEKTRSVAASEALLVREGLPAEAIVIEPSGSIQDLTSLDGGYYRPLVGGLQIQYSDWYGTFNCSQGFPVEVQRQNGTFWSGDYFLTASHCGDYASTDSLAFGQPTTAYPLARELTDPPFYVGSGEWWDMCPQYHNCRDSDVTLVKVNDGASSRHGYVALTAIGSLKILGQHSIHGVRGYLYSGLPVRKVGRTTGTTTGVITNPCANFDKGASVVVCQIWTTLTAGGGDSGAPVFFVDGSDQYWAVGGLWGIDTVSYNVIVSNWQSIQEEFEDHILDEFTEHVQFAVAAEIPLLATLNGPPLIESMAQYSWTVNASGGTGLYGYVWELRTYGEDWEEIGTDDTVYLFVNESWEPYFHLRVTVTSGGQQKEKTLKVNVDI